MGEMHDDIPIHPDLQSTSVMPPQNNLHVPPRQSLEADHSDYPRRRAIIACEICRGRKTRCDGGKPKCRLCTDLGADCVYREPGQKLDAGDKMIIEQLHRIEGMLHMMDQTGSLSHGPDDFFHVRREQNVSHATTTYSQPTSTLFDEVSNGPITSNLLAQPQPATAGLSAELNRTVLPTSSKAMPDLSAIPSRIESYFHRMHDRHALINPNTWQAVYATASLSNFSRSIEACTVLLIAALGSCATDRHLLVESTITGEVPGIAFFSRAWSMLPEVMLSNSVSAIHCLVLASAYFLEIHRPLDAWNTLNLATSKLDLQTSSSREQGEAEREQLKRAFWNTRLMKWSIMTALDVSNPSDIPPRSSSWSLPSPYQPNVKSDNDNEDISFFLAHVNLQQLAERISRTIPKTASNAFNMDAILPVAAEFDDQLSQWYDRLPESLQFPHEGYPAGGPAQNSLRHGFFECRAAIFRPFVLALVNNAELAANHTLTVCCKKCLEASVRQIECFL